MLGQHDEPRMDSSHPLVSGLLTMQLGKDQDSVPLAAAASPITPQALNGPLVQRQEKC